LRGRLRSAVTAANCSRSSALKTTHTCCAIKGSINFAGNRLLKSVRRGFSASWSGDLCKEPVTFRGSP
jgi:hypothetical protein